jgi:hypothetical protein
VGRPKGSKNKPKVLDSTPTTVSNSIKISPLSKQDKVDKLLSTKKVTPTISTPTGKKTVKQVASVISKQEKLKKCLLQQKQ